NPSAVLKISVGGGGCPLADGEPQALTLSLMDMDGDRRPDLVDAASGAWYRNQGDGFEFGMHGVGRLLPVWFPNALGRSTVHQFVTMPDELAWNQVGQDF